MVARAGAGGLALWYGVTLLGSQAWETLPVWVAVVAVVALAYTLIRGGSGTAVEGLQATNRELQRQITELKQDVSALTKENAELRGRTDVTLAIAPLISWSENHERNAAKRSEAMLDVLDMIATRLGKETEE